MDSANSDVILNVGRPI